MERTVHLVDDVLDVDVAEHSVQGEIRESSFKVDIIEHTEAGAHAPDGLISHIVEEALDVSIIENILSVEITDGGVGSSAPIWCGPVVELPASNTVYAEVELPEMVFEYNQHGRLDSVFEAEI